MRFGSTRAMVEALKHYVGVDLSHGEVTRRCHGGVIVENASIGRNEMRAIEDFAYRTGSIEVEMWSAWQTIVHRTV